MMQAAVEAAIRDGNFMMLADDPLYQACAEVAGLVNVGLAATCP